MDTNEYLPHIEFHRLMTLRKHRDKKYIFYGQVNLGLLDVTEFFQTKQSIYGECSPPHRLLERQPLRGSHWLSQKRGKECRAKKEICLHAANTFLVFYPFVFRKMPNPNTKEISPYKAIIVVSSHLSPFKHFYLKDNGKQ